MLMWISGLCSVAAHMYSFYSCFGFFFYIYLMFFSKAFICTLVDYSGMELVVLDWFVILLLEPNEQENDNS